MDRKLCKTSIKWRKG